MATDSTQQAPELPVKATEDQARELRAALDVQLERVRSLSYEQRLALSVDEQLSQFLIISSAYPDDALSKAVLMTHSTTINSFVYPVHAHDERSHATNHTAHSANDSDTERLPLHLACDTNAPIEIIRWLLDNDPTTTNESMKRKDKWGDLPLHTSCSRKDVKVVKLLVERDATKETVLIKDNDGSLPIHMACRYNAPAEAIQLLLDADATNTSLFTGGSYDQLPLHVACRCQLAPESIQLLLEHDIDKKTVLMEDNAGRLPLHVAYLRNNNPPVLQLILDAMIGQQRILRIGIDLWKRDMRQFLTSLSTRERDFTANDRLEMTREVLNELLERAFVLELAVWKVSMDAGRRNKNNNNKIAGTGGETDSLEDSIAFKQDCRIRCGSDIIIPGVLAFLEDEPVVQLFKKFDE